MKQLVVTFGISCSGKTTWVKRNGFEHYVISPDDLMKQYVSPKLQEDGSFRVEYTSDKVVWTKLFEILDYRMKNGELTVIDANNLNKKHWRRYKQMCRQYGYELVVANFSEVEIEEIHLRNFERKGALDYVKGEVIEEQHNQIDEIWEYVKTIIDYGAGRNFQKTLGDRLWKDLSHYKKVHHFGDIHGSYDALMTYLVGGKIKDDEAYIFVGDYIDRGTQNVEVVKFLTSLRNKPNVFFLEGNHDTRLARFSKGREVSSHEQFNKTKSEFARAIRNEEIDLSYVREWADTFKDSLFYMYLGKKVYVTHGGLSTVPEFLNGIASKDLINGTGTREFDVDNAFQDYVNRTGQDIVQIHGHRNRFKLKSATYPNSINLEGQVEFGGDLRVYTLERDDDNKVIGAEHYIPNRNFHPFYNEPDLIVYDNDVNRMIEEMSKGKKVSFSQTEDEEIIFSVGENNNLPDDLKNIKFVSVNSENHITHRSYDRMYKVNETKETKLVNLIENLSFPVVGYHKYDGYLVELSYSESNDKLTVVVDDPDIEVEDVGNLFHGTFNKEQMDLLKNVAKEDRVTFHFQIIDDEYKHSVLLYGHSRPQIMLLDAVKNKVKLETIEDIRLHEFVGEFNELSNDNSIGELRFKQFAVNQNTPEGFLKAYRTIKSNIYDFKCEGFVFEDAKGFRFTLDTNWYTLVSGYVHGMRYLGTPLVFNESWFDDVNISVLRKLEEAYTDLIAGIENEQG